MGLFYRCIVSGEVIDDISWNYMPEPGCPDADSESSNLVPLQSHPVSERRQHVFNLRSSPSFQKCLYVFNPTSTEREPVLGR